ncbi:Outer membrane receptor proteins, mostly Fe transport [Algoriphagus hitonicola]|uniref:Outer membrane receptor proteins, mostly Fe transport n=2 Tax=Algoriphagus hitonicola TaxID=435880 RepID=A0A1I2W543_9BACT|nr:Outer membrane receptor proteins, mostly Fe transport [Algoriphagus hitonicola]
MHLLMKSIFLSAFFGLCFSAGLMAQEKSVKGKLIDQENQEPLAYVQVALFKSLDDSDPVSFSDTDESGNFNLSAPEGTYFLKAFFLGFEDLVVPDIDLSQSQELGELEMVSESAALEEVVVQTTKMPVRSTMEGITVTPENNLANAGGTLLDILRNTPSISVSEDGSISLRGSTGTNILINGRNSSLTRNLDQLPASAIEEIKIINNPNARFDAEAEGGVIDIILKKGQDFGTHGSVEGTYGTRNRSNIGGSVNHRGKKWNVYGGYNYRDWKNVGERTSVREIFDRNEILDQSTRSSSRRTGHNVNYGADYYFGNNVISYEGVYQYGINYQTNTLFAELDRIIDGETDSFDYVRRNTEDESDEGFDNALIFEHSFKDKGHTLRALVSQSYTNQFKTQNIDIFRNTLNPDPSNLNGQERAFTDEVRNTFIFQADYIKPLDEDRKIEAGLKSNLRKFDNDYSYARLDEQSQEFVEDPAVSNVFLYEDQIHAGYFIYSNAGGKFEYTLGLRGEMTFVDTYLANTDERGSQEYFNFFPSVQTMYNLNDNHSLKFTYSRRIDRPTAWRLNPFPDITDSLNVRRGNPNLQPEMIDSFEFGHLANFDNSSFATNVFYRQTEGQLDYITIIEDGVSYSQPDNLLSSSSYGVEFVGVSEVNNWYTINGGVTLFRISVDGSNIGEEFTNSGFSWNTKLTQDFKLPYGFNFQLVGNYESPEIEAQGRDLSQYYVDASLQKGFMENRGSVTLSVRDVFDTRRWAGFALTNTFSQDFYSKRETRIALISARYSF